MMDEMLLWTGLMGGTPLAFELIRRAAGWWLGAIHPRIMVPQLDPFPPDPWDVREEGV